MASTYFQTAETIWSNTGLSPTQKLVALCLLEHRNEETSKCYPQHERIMLRTGLGRTAVFLALRGLKDLGVVWWFKGDKRLGRANEYYFSVDHARHSPGQKSAR